MTEKLYYQDSYISEFNSKVISSDKVGDNYEIVLEKTAFFPEEGGQYADKGFIDGIEVLNVIERNGVIFHLTNAPIAVGTSVKGKIDFEERYEKMQCHTAEHILSGLIHKYHNLDNVGFHLGAEEVTMDISAPLSLAELIKIEAMANEVVYANVPVVCSFPEKEVLGKLEYRSKLSLTENVRIVDIGEYDSCACCAPHVKSTGEIGLIKILDFSGLRGGIRIRIAAGRRAMRIFNAMQTNLAEISRLTSTPRLECAEAVKRIMLTLDEMKASLKEARLSFYTKEASEIKPDEKNVVILYPDASVDELRTVANIATDRIGGMLVLLTGEENDYKYVISSNSVDLKCETKKINAALFGRGGGSSRMIQGGFNASIAKIREFFE